jgi:hypothetical protein
MYRPRTQFSFSRSFAEMSITHKHKSPLVHVTHDSACGTCVYTAAAVNSDVIITSIKRQRAPSKTCLADVKRMVFAWSFLYVSLSWNSFSFLSSLFLAFCHLSSLYLSFEDMVRLSISPYCKPLVWSRQIPRDTHNTNCQ